MAKELRKKVGVKRMKTLKLMFLVSACIHLVVIGVFLLGTNSSKRSTPVSIHRVRIVEVKKEAAGVSRPLEAAQVKMEEPDKEIKVSTASKDEEESKKLEEFLKKRKKLEELRKKREEGLEREREKKQEELRKLDGWTKELGDRKTLEELTLDSAAIFPAWFIDEIHNRIFSVWEVPPAAGKAQARIGFEISRSGQTSSIAVEKSSGNSIFDLSCQEAVRKASPFPRLPELFKGEKVRVHVTFREE